MEDKKIENFKKELSGITDNIEQLKQDKTKIILDIKSDIKKWCGKHIGWTIGGISILTLYALFQIYTNVVNKSEEFITDTITFKFAEPQIAQTFNSVAENQAKAIIETNLNPAIQKATATINQKIKSFETNLQQFKDKYDTELTRLSKEVEYLKNRNMLLRLSDKAIAEADAQSFDKLESIYESTLDEDLKLVALSEIYRVKLAFLNTTRIKGVEITYTDKRTGKVFKDTEIPTEALIGNLNNNTDWRVRARAIEILKSRKEKQVPETLLNAIQNDKNLEVRAKAVKSFERVTGFKNTDVLNFLPVKNWWKTNQDSVNLKDLQTIQSAIENNSENKN
ncbi:MAG: HEAT repeat domain-containing protein [bacterium]